MRTYHVVCKEVTTFIVEVRAENQDHACEWCIYVKVRKNDKEQNVLMIRTNNKPYTRFTLNTGNMVTKSKDTLSELDTFTVETREGINGNELVFKIGTDITNTIEFTVNASIKESFSPVPFDSNLFKEVLKANRTYETCKIHINKNGLLDASFTFDNNCSFYTNYYLVRKQETN